MNDKCDDIKITPSMISRFLSKVNKNTTNGCWDWNAGSFSSGYGAFSIKRKIVVRAHRFSWLLFSGKSAGHLKVCHKCDRPSCVNPDHLFLGTDGDNLSDRDNKNRNVFGIKHPNAKLNGKIVEEIRGKQGSHSSKQVAEMYNISASHVRNLWRKGCYWKKSE